MYNSLKPLIHWPLERSGSNSISAFFKLRNGLSGISSETGLSWVPQNPLDDKSILSHAMAWCHQATNHYLVLCWLRSMSPYGITRLQWVQWTITATCILLSFVQNAVGPSAAPPLGEAFRGLWVQGATNHSNGHTSCTVRPTFAPRVEDKINRIFLSVMFDHLFLFLVIFLLMPSMLFLLGIEHRDDAQLPLPNKCGRRSLKC